MSLELHVLVERDRLPSRDSWQQAIDKLELPMVLDPSLQIPSETGFLPCMLDGSETGFELYWDFAPDLISEYPTLEDLAGSRNFAASFRWGGDLNECACVMAAAAGLVSGFAGVAYYPDDDLHYTLEDLVGDFRECLKG